MATVPEVRAALIEIVRSAVYGSFRGVGHDLNIYQEARSSYSTEHWLGPRRGMVTFSPVSLVDLVPVDPQAPLTLLQPGEKTFQFRLWVIEEDLTLDSNIPSEVVGVEIEVHRKMLFPEDELLYAIDEMLNNQTVLVNKSRWTDLSEVASLVEGPSIERPELDGDVLSYTVSAIVEVAPN